VTAFLKRIAHWLGKREPAEDFDAEKWLKTTVVMVPVPEYDALVADAEKWRAQYLNDFGPNVPVEDLGGKPVGMEKAP
jgi:hypothetical protein